jgi:hypothetical protein
MARTGAVADRPVTVPLAIITQGAQSPGMSITFIVPFLVALGSLASSAQSQNHENEMYGASVSFRDGECWFWTGDVGLTASQFERDLAERFDRKRGIVISYVADTPKRCVKQALRSASRAGFQIVRPVASPDAGPIGPPSHGS